MAILRQLLPLSLYVFLGGTLSLAPAGPSAAQEKPRYGGTLIQAIAPNPDHFIPILTTGVHIHSVGCKIYSGLLASRRDGTLGPDLAKSWEVSPDGLTYTFHLERDVRFHDGKPLTSADVKFTFEQVVAKFHPRARLVMADVQSVETPGPHTVVIKLKRSFGPFLLSMTCPESGILPKHLWEGTDILKNPQGLKPVGTGPFMFREAVAGSHVALARNPNYFKKGLPYLDRIFLKVIPDTPARVLALEAGEADFIASYFFPKQQFTRLSKMKEFQFQKDTDTPGNAVIHFNLQRKPLDDARVRRALYTALNRKLIVERADFGLGNEASTPLDSRFPWLVTPEADYRKAYPYDPARANRLLDEAGHPKKADGARFTVSVVYMSSHPLLPPTSEILRSNWADVGVKVSLVGVERGVMQERVFGKRDYDVTLQTYTSAGDPVGLVRIYAANESRSVFVNPTWYSNPKVDELFHQGATATDLKKRGERYQEASKILVADIPSAILLERSEVDVARAKFRGLWQAKTPYERWDEVWMAGGREKP
ncbi:MAG: ABC transporter substrate-binding protein [Nitrospinota bacterium]